MRSRQAGRGLQRGNHGENPVSSCHFPLAGPFRRRGSGGSRPCVHGSGRSGPDVVRVSIGIEDAGNIIAELEPALAGVCGSRRSPYGARQGAEGGAGPRGSCRAHGKGDARREPRGPAARPMRRGACPTAAGRAEDLSPLTANLRTIHRITAAGSGAAARAPQTFEMMRLTTGAPLRAACAAVRSGDPAVTPAIAPWSPRGRRRS